MIKTMHHGKPIDEDPIAVARRAPEKMYHG